MHVERVHIERTNVSLCGSPYVVRTAFDGDDDVIDFRFCRSARIAVTPRNVWSFAVLMDEFQSVDCIESSARIFQRSDIAQFSIEVAHPDSGGRAVLPFDGAALNV